MSTMNVSLPAPMKDWIEAQLASGDYGNASEYVRDLIRRDQERKRKIAAFQKLVDEGLASGESDKTVEEIFDEARRIARG